MIISNIEHTLTHTRTSEYPCPDLRLLCVEINLLTFGVVNSGFQVDCSAELLKTLDSACNYSSGFVQRQN